MKKIRLVAAAILLVAYALYRFEGVEAQRQAASEQVLADAMTIVRQVEGYYADQSIIDDLASRAHRKAYTFCYSGTASPQWHASEPSSYNDDRYLKSLFVFLWQEISKDMDEAPKVSQIDRLRDIRRRLEDLREQLGIEGLPGL